MGQVSETGEADLLAEMRRQYPYATLDAHMIDQAGIVRPRCARCRERPVPAWSIIQACDPCLQEMTAGIVRLPHAPIWNLLPMGGKRRRKEPPWECIWHGTIEDEKCAGCHREHAEYLGTGTWVP